jgi:hypothetical protein
MKNLFALGLVLNLNLFTMDCAHKHNHHVMDFTHRNNHHNRKDYIKIISAGRKDLLDILSNTTLNDLKRNAQKRKHEDECCFFPNINRLFSRIERYINQ